MGVGNDGVGKGQGGVEGNGGVANVQKVLGGITPVEKYSTISGRVQHVAFSPDDGQLAVVDFFGTVTMLDALSGAVE